MLCTQHKMSHRWKLPKISIACYQYGPECRPLITECIKKTAESSPPFFLLIYTSFYPIRPAVQPYQFSAVLAFDLQNRPLCFSSLISKMRRLHLGLGHLITSICRRLLYIQTANRPYFLTLTTASPH